MIMNDHDTAFWKVAIAWLGTVFGCVTLSGTVLTLTALFTALQIYVLVRDKIWKKK